MTKQSGTKSSGKQKAGKSYIRSHQDTKTPVASSGNQPVKKPLKK